MSAIIPGIMDINDVVHGDLFDISFDIEGIDLTGKTLLMQVKKGMDMPIVLEFKESDNSLVKSVTSTTLTSVTLRKSSVLMKAVPLGLYQYSIIMYTVADDEQTIVTGTFDVVIKIAEKPTS